MKRKILVGLALVGIPLAAWANCTHFTMMVGDRVVPCTICCTPEGQCVTRCF
ncbi:MAG: hypothetical protein RL156_1763 [Bacteroidota bacterium]|jgi:hypothetical protein